MLSDGRGLRARRTTTRYNISSMASAPCPYFVKFGYCRAHTKEAEIKAKVVAAKEAEIMKEACVIVDDFLTATAEAGMENQTKNTSREEYLAKIVRDLKKEKKHADWNMQHAVMDEMRRQKLHHCPFAHHRELLRDLQGMKLREGATKEERMLIHRSNTAFTSLNSNEDLLHATLEHILSFDKGFEVPEDVLLSLEQKKEEVDEEEDEDGASNKKDGKEEEDDTPFDMDAFVAPMVKLRAPIKFLEKSAFVDTSAAATNANGSQQQTLVIPISLNIAHIPALVEYFAPQVLERHNRKKRNKAENAKKKKKEKNKSTGKKKKGKAETEPDEPPLFTLPQYVVTAKQVNFSDAFFVQNFFALISHVARKRWTKERHFRASRLPEGLSHLALSQGGGNMRSTVEEIAADDNCDKEKKNKKSSTAVAVSAPPPSASLIFPFKVLAMQYCDIINAEELFNAVRKDAYHRTNLRVADLSHNKLDSLKFLFQLRAFFSTTSSASTNTTAVTAAGGNAAAGSSLLTTPSLSSGGRIVSMWLAHNPITRKPDYRQQIRKTLPALLMLDGTRLRKLPLGLPFPSVSRWNFPFYRKAHSDQTRALFDAFGPFFNPKKKLTKNTSGKDDDAKSDEEEELTEEEKARNERLKKMWADTFEKIAASKKEREVQAEGERQAEAAAKGTLPPPRPNPRFQIANGKEFDAVTSFVYRYLFYWEKGEVPFSMFQHQHLLSMSSSLQQLVEEEADREHALMTAAIGKKKKKKAAKDGETPAKDDKEDDNALTKKKDGKTGAGEEEDEDTDLVTEVEERKRLEYARRLAVLSAGHNPNVDEMISEGLVSHLDTELYSLEGFRSGSEEVDIFAKYLNMIPRSELDSIMAERAKQAEDNGLLLSNTDRTKSTPMANIVDITYENFAAKFLHPSATVSVTVSPACSWYDATKMFNKSEVTTSHNRLNVLDAKLLWRLTGESAALRSYFYTPPPQLTQNAKAVGDSDLNEDDDDVDENMSTSGSSSSSASDNEDDANEEKKNPLTLQSRLASYQVEFARSLAGRGRNKRRTRTIRRGGAVDNQAARGKLILRSGKDDVPSGVLPSHVAGNKSGGYIPGHKAATSALGMTVSRDFLRQIMLLSPMDLQDLRLLDTALKTQSRNLIDSIHQEVRHRIARGPMNAFNLYRSTVYPLGSINSALQSSGAVAMTDAATTTAGKKIRAHLLEKMRVPTGRSGGIEVKHHLQHAPTMSVQVVTDQIHEIKQAAKAEEEAKRKAAAASSAPTAAFGNLSHFNKQADSQPQGETNSTATTGPSLTIEEIDALRYNSKGEKISDTAHKIKVMLALRELQKKFNAEKEAKGEKGIVFQNVADPKDRKRSRSGAADTTAKSIEAEKAAAIAAVAEANTKLFGVPLQEQSKPPFYLVTLHGTMTWKTPTMASQPLLPGASIESTLAYNGQDPSTHDHINGQRPTDVLSFAFPNGISCHCDRTLTVTAQRVEIALPLKQMDPVDLEAADDSGLNNDVPSTKAKKIREIQHTPPFIAALARERLLALGYVDCPRNIDYYNDRRDDEESRKSKKTKGGARIEDGEVPPSYASYGPMPQEYFTLNVRKLFIYNDHMNLRPSGVGTSFVTPAAVGSAGSGKYQNTDRRVANVSDQQGNVIYTHLRVDKVDELELEHCGDAGSEDDEEETDQRTTVIANKRNQNGQKSDPELTSRQFIQQVLERSESDRAVYEALREAFGARNMTAEEKEKAQKELEEKVKREEDERKAAAKNKKNKKNKNNTEVQSDSTQNTTAAGVEIPFTPVGVQQLLRRHSSLSSK